MVDEVRRMRPIGSRVDKMLGASAVALASGVGVVATSENSEAAIIYSGVVNIGVPNNIDGVYLNVVTGATGAAGDGVSGWDINPYSSTSGLNTFNLFGPDATTWLFTGVNQYRLAGGSIGPTGTFATPAGGTNVGPQMILNTSDGNFLGFRFVNETLGNQVQFGWVQLRFGADTGDRTIIGYAYENTGVAIEVSAVPEPSTLALLATGAVGLFAARRRRQMAVAAEPTAV